MTQSVEFRIQEIGDDPIEVVTSERADVRGLQNVY
jgi:hypothetical protein